MKERYNRAELIEDATKYGEYVCSNFHWLPIKQQKKQARRMENMTKQEIIRAKKEK